MRGELGPLCVHHVGVWLWIWMSQGMCTCTWVLWVQENTVVSVTVKLGVCVLVCVWRCVCMREWVCVYMWPAAQGIFECEITGMHFTCEWV